MTSFDPIITAAYGRPHAFAWNIGTTGVIASRSHSPITSASAIPNECSTSDRCEYSTPLGWPVVPVV